MTPLERNGIATGQVSHKDGRLGRINIDRAHHRAGGTMMAPEKQALLNEIRDPTPAMISAAVAKAEEVGPHDHVAIWKAMVDAASNP